MSILIFLTGLVFAIMGFFGYTLTVNQADINAIIFGLGSIIAVSIELFPLIFELMRDKKFRELFSIVNDVVYAVESLDGLTSLQKKNQAMAAVKKICYQRDIEFDSEKVSNMIESIIDIYNTVVKK